MKRKLIPLTIIIAGGLIILLSRPIKVGVLFSLDSSVGNEQNLTVQYYANKYKRIGLRPVKLVIETPSLKEDSIIEGFHNLRKNGVVVIIGAALSSEAIVLAPLAKKYRIPVITPTASTSVLSKQKDNFYQLLMNTESQGIITGRFLNKKGYTRTVLVLSEPNKAFSESLGNGFISSFEGDTLKVFNNSQNPDFKRISDYNPDSIFFIVSSGEMIKYLRFLSEELPDTRVITSSWGYQQLLQVFSGPQIDGIYVVSVTGDDIDDKFFKESIEFEKTFKLKTTYIFGLAYTGMEEIYNAIRNGGSSREGIIEYLNTPREFISSYGSYWTNEFGDSVGEFYYFYEIVNNEIELLDKFPIGEYYEAKK